MSSHDRETTDGSPASRHRLKRPMLWFGLALGLVGIIFNLGLFFVPIWIVLENPGLVPMPEQLVGWWAVAVGLFMMLWSQRRRGPA